MDDHGSQTDKLHKLITVLLIFAMGMMLGRIVGRLLFQTL
jgi:hypothetical protein